MSKVVLLMISLLLIGGCSACSSNPEAPTVGEVSELPDTKTTTPLWAEDNQEDGQLFQELNLDGVGNADDSAYICTYRFDDYEGKNTILFVHLGTGETLAKVFPVYGHYSFQTGRLFDENKEAIVIEVDIPGSNYGAANIFILGIDPSGIDELGIYRDPQLVIFLDSYNSENNEISNSLMHEIGDQKSGNIISGSTIVDVTGLPLQAIDLKTRSSTNIIYWDRSSSCWLFYN